MNDALISAIVSAAISGVLVAWFKHSIEANAKTREENMGLKFQSVYNKIEGVSNRVGEVRNEMVVVKGQMQRHQEQTNSIDKRLEVLVAKQEYIKERVDSILAQKIHDENYGKVIRRE